VLYLIFTVHVLVCVFLILVVLLQQGKGADLSVFGGGSTQTAFGARGATTFLHKLTVFSFIIFVLTTLGIGILQGRNPSVLKNGAAARKPAAAPARTPGGTAVPVAPARPANGPGAATPAAAPLTPGAPGAGVPQAPKATPASPAPAAKIPPPNPGTPR
jgi:preprotein translocase subunit SecG